MKKFLFRKLYLLKLFPVFFLWIGIGLLSSALLFYFYKHYEESLLLKGYFLIQVFIWVGLGYFLRKAYISTYKDELTNLWNRRYLYIRLGDELNSLGKDLFLSLAIIDVDNFKCINDTFGHLFGDHVLQEVASVLQRHLRKKDILVRWGGEEFVIILPRTDLEGAKIVFDRIRKKIETYDFGCRVTISGGIAFVDESIYLDRLIEMADQALYQAKKSKNRMVVYGR